MSDNHAQLDALIDSFRGKHGSLIPLLQQVQALEGYLSRKTMRYVADRIGVPAAEIYGVATFYSIFHLEPQGKHVIKVCKGTACHVSRANAIATMLRDELKLEAGEITTADMRFTLIEVACLGCCSLAPVIMIDGQTFGKLSPESIPGVLERFAF